MKKSFRVAVCFLLAMVMMIGCLDTVWAGDMGGQLKDKYRAYLNVGSNIKVWDGHQYLNCNVTKYFSKNKYYEVIANGDDTYRIGNVRLVVFEPFQENNEYSFQIRFKCYKKSGNKWKATKYWTGDAPMSALDFSKITKKSMEFAYDWNATTLADNVNVRDLKTGVVLKTIKDKGTSIKEKALRMNRDQNGFDVVCVTTYHGHRTTATIDARYIYMQ